MLRSDVLPAPLGPMIDTSSPPWTDSETFSTARTPPKCFDTLAMASCVSPEVSAAALKLRDTMPPHFLTCPLHSLMSCPYGRHTADACAKMQSPHNHCTRLNVVFTRF